MTYIVSFKLIQSKYDLHFELTSYNAAERFNLKDNTDQCLRINFNNKTISIAWSTIPY